MNIEKLHSLTAASWYSRAIMECLGKGKFEEKKWKKCLEKINYFKRQLAEEKRHRNDKESSCICKKKRKFSGPKIFSVS
jgi:hypothetical protein